MGVFLSYLGISCFVADRLTRPERHPITSNPGDLGLAYGSVEFESAEDGLTLRGWWIPSQESDRAIILVHGRSSNRSGFNPQPGTPGGLLVQAKGIVERGYSVLSFDLRGHSLTEIATPWGRWSGVMYAEQSLMYRAAAFWPAESVSCVIRWERPPVSYPRRKCRI